MINGRQVEAKPGSATPAIVFTGCNGLQTGSQAASAAGGSTGLQAATAASAGAASAAQAATKRREVSVNGRRVKTIDVHAHCVIPEALALQGKRAEDERGPGLGEVGARRIREMDEQGVDVEALSINPHWHHAERDLAALGRLAVDRVDRR